MLTIRTLSGNLLVHFMEKNKKRFIYIDKAGNYLPAEFEKRSGLAINETEWNNLKSKKEPTGATEIEFVQAQKATIKRKEMLSLTTQKEREQWAITHCPKKSPPTPVVKKVEVKKTAKHFVQTKGVNHNKPLTYTPFEKLKNILFKKGKGKQKKAA